MTYRTEDLRIASIGEVLTPDELHREFPVSETAARTVHDARAAIHRILHGEDDPIVLSSGSQNFFEGLPTSGSDLRIYPELRHEIFNEPEGEDILGDVIAWIGDREAR